MRARSAVPHAKKGAGYAINLLLPETTTGSHLRNAANLSKEWGPPLTSKHHNVIRGTHWGSSVYRPVPFETIPAGRTSIKGPAVRGARWVLCIIGRLDAIANETYL